MISDLTPRKGHFSFSPWQRHGKTIHQKECAPKGYPNMPGPSERVASSLCAPWRAETLRLSLRVGITAHGNAMGRVRYKTKIYKGRPMMTPPFGRGRAGSGGFEAR
jgi:hypothetical protein